MEISPAKSRGPKPKPGTRESLIQTGMRLALFGLRICGISTLFLASTQAFAEPAVRPVTVGVAAPELQLSKTYGESGSSKLTLSSLKGKVVVLEFWATWCAPCMGEITAINSLTKEVDPSKVVFVSITDEDESVIQRFLKKRNLTGFIALDDQGKTFARYGVSERPTTFVIGPNGRVISAELHPHELSGVQLMNLARKGNVSLSATNSAQRNAAAARETSKAFKEQITEAGGAANAEDALFRISVARGSSTDKPHVIQREKQEFDMLNLPLPELVHLALGVTLVRIHFDNDVPKAQSFNLSVRAKNASTLKLRSALELAIETGAGVRLNHHAAQEDVYHLIRVPGKIGHVDEVEGGKNLAFFDSSKGEFTNMDASSEQIALAAEDFLKVPVIDQSEGAFCDAHFAVSEGNLEQLQKGLEEACGLTLKKGVDTVDRIDISSPKTS